MTRGRRKAAPEWPKWSTALPDWERKIAAGESIMPMPPLFPVAAKHGLSIFKALRVVDAIGSPTFGESSKQWLLDLVSVIFGSYDPETNRRAIREILLLISKKNSKSTTAAGIMLTLLIMNARKGGEMGIMAPTLEVANNAWRPIRDAIRVDDELRTILHVSENTRTVRHLHTEATLQVVAADAETVAGKKWIYTLIDELWLFGKKPNADKLIVEATGGLASRPEGFVMYSSTQSDDPPAGVFRQKLMYARGVRDGTIDDPTFLPVLYEFPAPMLHPSDDFRKPENFYITNPNLGVSVDEGYLKRELQKAEIAGAEALAIFYSKHLNVEVGLALRSDRWAGADFWAAAGNRALTFESLLERCEVVVAGIDGGGLDDLLGLAIVGREKATRRWLHWAHAWAHPIALERHKDIAPRLRDFEKLGQLTIVDRPGDDVIQVCDCLSRVKAAGLLPPKSAVGVDAFGIADIVKELSKPERKFAEGSIVAISQGWKLNGAIKTVERMVAGGSFEHGALELMAWSVANAKVVPVGNAISINKQVNGSGKIDPLMATFDAASLMALNPEAQKKRYTIQFI